MDGGSLWTSFVPPVVCPVCHVLSLRSAPLYSEMSDFFFFLSIPPHLRSSQLAEQLPGRAKKEDKSCGGEVSDGRPESSRQGTAEATSSR